jgi:predicted N-acetyltransferase YhbS
MSGVTIRLARPDDLPHVPTIETSAAEIFARHGQPLGDGWSPTQPEQCEGPLSAGLIWIADDEAAGPVGFLAAEVVGDTLHVDEVDVVMPRQRQGLGRRLMEAAIAAAKAKGLAAVTLTTFRDIPWNAPFYASLGFVEFPPDEIPGHLAEENAAQAARGYVGRCAMRLVL